jgi:hypothetical protein
MTYFVELLTFLIFIENGNISAISSCHYQAKISKEKANIINLNT